MKILIVSCRCYIIFSIISASQFARASDYINFLIQPIAGYQKSLSGESTPNSIKTEYNYDGLVYGATIAMATPSKSFGLGGEFILSNIDFESKASGSSATSTSANKVDGSIIAIFNMGRFRAIPKYIYSSSVEYSEGLNKEDKILGSGFGLTLGFHIFKYLALDFGYNIIKNKKSFIKSTNTTSSISAIDLQELTVTISAPLYIDMGFLRIFDF